MIEIVTILPPATPPPDAATVMVATAETGPAYPSALAVIEVVPAPTAVATPELSTEATVGVLDVQVTPLVMVLV
jgi:hypothetical protein